MTGASVLLVRDVWALADALLAVIIAPRCAACAAPLERPLRGPVCAACWSAILPLDPSLCETCGDALCHSHGFHECVCASCVRSGHPIAKARAAGRYEGRLRDIVHAFKYGGGRSLASPLAALMQARGAAVLEHADAVVAVPLHSSRRRARGFNQADDLARRLGLPVVRALRRVNPTQPQASLPASARRHNVGHAFAATRRASALRGAIVVLVDDVATTGATLEACARVLRRIGAREVRALTAARVVKPRR